MSNSRAQKIQVLKKVFSRARNAPRDKDGWFQDLDLHTKLGCALFEARDSNLEELKGDIQTYLKDPFEEFRSSAEKFMGQFDRRYEISSQARKTQDLKKIFEQVKNESRDDDGWLTDLDLHGALGCALVQVGKERLYELRDEVYLYLKDPFAEFRADAVKTLGWDTRLFDEDFCKNDAYQIWLNDTDDDVRYAALNAWADYHRDTKDPFVLKTLYDVFLSEHYTPWIKAWALYNFINVAEASYYPRGLCDISVFENCYLEKQDYLGEDKFLSDQVDWQKVHGIMDKYVPNWRTKAGA